LLFNSPVRREGAVSAMSAVAIEQLKLEKPDTDYREYARVVLPNKLEAILIHDEKADKSACCLDVNAGFLENGPIEGLSHFCEHMLFLGSEKFPEEDLYMATLNKAGGSFNATTYWQNTNYFFDIAPDQFSHILDQFSQFFKAPLFTENSTDREMNAVDSEHKLQLKHDMARVYNVVLALGNPDCKLQLFGCGNLKSLRDDPKERGLNIRDELLKFHKKHYSANVMKVAILSSDPFEKLRDLVVEHFADIPNYDVEVPTGPQRSGGAPPFRDDQLPAYIRVLPISPAFRYAFFKFILPEMAPRWRTKPSDVIAHLLGHEGQGSLFEELKKRGLALELSAGTWIDAGGWNLFGVDIKLTEKGIQPESIEEIGELLFTYIQILQTQGIAEIHHRERKIMADLNFKFQSMSGAMNHCQRVARNMQNLPSDYVLSGDGRCFEFDPAECQEIIKCLSVNNCLVLVADSSAADACDQVEQWYQTKYSKGPLSDATRRRWEACAQADTKEKAEAQAKERGIFLPPPNPFLPDDVSLRPITGELPPYPVHLTDDGKEPVVQIYHRQDGTFKQPKCQIMMRIATAYTAVGDVRRTVLTKMWADCLEEGLSSYAYDAQVARLAYTVSIMERCILVAVSGYNDKMPTLIAKVAEAMASKDDVPVAIWERVKERYRTQLQEAIAKQPPVQQTVQLMNKVISQFSFTPEQKLETLEALDRSDLQGMARNLFDDCFVEMLAQGNLTPEETRACAKSLLGPLEMKRKFDKIPVEKFARIDTNLGVMVEKGRNAEEPQGCVIGLMQVCDNNDIEKCSMLQVAVQCMSQECFTKLRTKQQLGYMAGAQAFGSVISSLIIFVVTPKNPQMVQRRMAAFLDTRLKELSSGDLSDEEFQQYRDAVITEMSEKHKSLSEEFGENWEEVVSRRFTFGRRLRQIEFLKTLTKDKFEQFLKDTLCETKAVWMRVEQHAAPDPEEAGTAPEAPDAPVIEPEALAAFRERAQWVSFDDSIVSNVSSI